MAFLLPFAVGMHARLNYATAAAFLLLMPLAPLVAGGPEPSIVQVMAVGGRTFSGQVDALTDGDDLVLRSGSDRAWVRRSIGWRRVLGAEYAGRQLTREELQTLAERIKTPPAEVLDLASVPSASVATTGHREDAVAEPPPAIAAMSFDAALANWDGDVEADGLIICLQPIDTWGFYAAASGSVEIELFARQARTFHHAPRSGGQSVERIARWTCAVTPSDFGPSGAVLKFPFGAAHPEFDGDLGSYGLVHVRLSVPGSGVFEDSQDGVRIRPFAPLRDTLQLNAGRRFLPSEQTGRGKTAFDGGR